MRDGVADLQKKKARVVENGGLIACVEKSTVIDECLELSRNRTGGNDDTAAEKRVRRGVAIV